MTATRTAGTYISGLFTESTAPKTMERDFIRKIETMDQILKDVSRVIFDTANQLDGDLIALKYRNVFDVYKNMMGGYVLSAHVYMIKNSDKKTLDGVEVILNKRGSLSVKTSAGLPVTYDDNDSFMRSFITTLSRNLPNFETDIKENDVAQNNLNILTDVFSKTFISIRRDINDLNKKHNLDFPPYLGTRRSLSSILMHY